PQRRGRRALGWAASLGLLAVAAAVARSRWQAVGEAGGIPGLEPAAVAVGAYLVGNTLLALNWRELVSLGAPRPPARTAVWIWSVSQLARYTVTLGQVAGRGVVARRYGLTATAGAVSTLLELTFYLSVSSALSLATLPWWLPLVRARWLAAIGALPFLVLAATLTHPHAVLRGLSRLLDTRLGRWVTRGRLQRLDERVEVSRARLARVAALYLANSAVRLAAFLVLLTAVGGDPARIGLQAVGAYAVGHLAGGLVVFAPGGIGAREGATTLVLAPALGADATLVLVAAVRLLEIVAELLLVGIARVLRGPAPAG
ncbi:MAG: flippase-like domain-containing protein, partial [Actinomycetota bacterium]|nr:flippase-like domain-containing protein [Actinomycetota bacterium]